MPRPFKWAEYFNKDAALQNRSNKYQVSCIRCQKKIPKGRSEERTRHLVEECTGLTLEEREQIVRVETKEAEVTVAGASKPNNRTPGGAEKGGFRDTEIEEILRLVRLRHPLENDDQGWQLLLGEYNNWAEANGFQKCTCDALKKQWNLRVGNRLRPTSAHTNFPWDVPESPWELSGIDSFDEGHSSDTDHDALGTVSSSGYSLPQPPRFDSELTSTLRAATPSPNLSPPQSTNSSQQRQPPPHRLPAYLRLPPTARGFQAQSEEPANIPGRVPPTSSSWIEFLEYENMQKAKRIEKLEARTDRLEEKVDKLDARNRKLEDQNRKLDNQSQMLKMQLMVAGGSISTKRKRGNSELLPSNFQGIVDD